MQGHHRCSLNDAAWFNSLCGLSWLGGQLASRRLSTSGVLSHVNRDAAIHGFLARRAWCRQSGAVVAMFNLEWTHPSWEPTSGFVWQHSKVRCERCKNIKCHAPVPAKPAGKYCERTTLAISGFTIREAFPRFQMHGQHSALTVLTADVTESTADVTT